MSLALTQLHFIGEPVKKQKNIYRLKEINRLPLPKEEAGGWATSVRKSEFTNLLLAVSLEPKHLLKDGYWSVDFFFDLCIKLFIYHTVCPLYAYSLMNYSKFIE